MVPANPFCQDKVILKRGKISPMGAINIATCNAERLQVAVAAAEK